MANVTLDSLIVEIRARDEKLTASLQAIEKQLTSVEGKITTTAQKVEKSFDVMAAGAKRAEAALKRLATTYLSFQSAKAFVKIAEDVSNLRAQVANLATVGDQSAEVFARLQSSAKQLGVPLESAVDLFTRLAFGTQNLGASNADLLKVADTLQKIGVVGKVSVENMSSALTQLGQIFTQGKFQGDELNIILAQAPQIIQAIADGLGMSTTELLKLRAAGKLTVEDTFKALLKVSDEVEEKFQNIPPTVSRAMASATVTISQAIDELNQKFAITETIANNIVGLTSRLSQAFNLETTTEKIARLQGQLRDLQDAAAAQAGGGLAGFGASFTRGPAAEIQRNIGDIIRQIDELKASLDDSNAALTQSAEIIKSKYTPEQLKAAEEIRKNNEALKERAETLNLSGAELAEYHKQQTLARTADAALAEETYRVVLALEQETEKTEAAAEATRKKAEADRKAEAERKRMEADRVKTIALINKLNFELFKTLEEENKVRAETLKGLEEETARLHEEGRLIQASLGPKEELRNIERQIAIDRINRSVASALAAAEAESKLTEEIEASIKAKGAAEIANVNLAASVTSYKDAIDQAALTTADLNTFTQGILGGTQNIGAVFEDLGQTMGTRMVEGILFGKGQNEQAIIGNFNNLLGVDAAGLFSSQGNALGSSLIDSIVQPLASGGGSLLKSAGIDLGGVFGSSFGEAAGSTASADFSNVIAGSSSTAASAGTSFGSIFGAFAGGAAGIGIGKGLSRALGIGGGGAGLGGTIGGGIGAVGGGIIGSFFGAPGIGAGIGGAAGTLFGSFIGSLFAHTPTRGTQIRKGVKDFLKEIEVSFASEIDSGEYFFEETKKLARKMFGGDDGKDFLKASKVLLEDKIGPELSQQLQALGTFITADQAKKLGKSVEQTGTTFGNMLLDNLGLDPETISDAITEIVQKAGIDFSTLANKLTGLFSKNKISVDFYRTTLQGAVQIFHSELPEAINVAAIALRSFGEDGLFSVEQFATALQEVTGTFDVIVASFVDVVKEAKPGEDVGLLLGEQITKGLEAAAVDAFLADFIKNRLFAGVDLSDGLGADELDLLKTRAHDARIEVEALWDAFGEAGPEVEAVTDKVEDLFDAIRKLTQQRFDLRLNVLGDLASIGAVSGVDVARTRIAGARGTLAGLGAATRTDFSDIELEQGLEAIRNMRQATVELFQAQEQAERDGLAKRIQGIGEEFEARREGLAREAQAAADASAARQEALSRERDDVQELFQSRIDGLQAELQIAEDFRRVAENLQQTINSLVQTSSPLSRPEQLAFFQRQAAELRGRIAGASAGERPGLIDELSSLLSSQLTIGRDFLDPTRFSALFTNVVSELENLRNQTTIEGNRTEILQQEIASATVQMEVQLRSIDEAIKQTQSDAEAAQRNLAEQTDMLSRLEREAVAQAEQETSARIDALRQEAAIEIRNLALIEDAILQEQLQRAREGVDISIEQLSVLSAINESSVRVEELLAEFLGSVISAQKGYDGMVTHPQLFLAHGNEHVKITPGGRPLEQVSVSMAVPISFNGAVDNPTAVEEAVIQAIADDIRRGGKIRRAIQGVT